MSAPATAEVNTASHPYLTGSGALAGLDGQGELGANQREGGAASLPLDPPPLQERENLDVPEGTIVGWIREAPTGTEEQEQA